MSFRFRVIFGRPCRWPSTVLRRSLSSSSPQVPAALQELAGHINQGKRVLFITGAGLSAASGVPTYRGSENSIWSQYVYEWGTRRKFWENPLKWYNEFWLPTHGLTIDSVRKMAQAKGIPTVLLKDTSSGTTLSSFTASILPNAGHTALNQIAAQTNVRIITQNVDGLQIIGMDPDTLQHRYIEAHGRADRYRCPPLQSPYPSDAMRFGTCVYSDDEVLSSIELPLVLLEGKSPQIEKVPECPACGTPLIPAVLFFDEMYTDHKVFAFDRILKWMYLAEVMVFVGTSNSVGLTEKALDVALRRRIPVYDFNINDSAFPGSVAIPGPSEELLPKLQMLIQPTVHITMPSWGVVTRAYFGMLFWEYVVTYIRPCLYLLAFGCILELLLRRLEIIAAPTEHLSE